MNVDLAVNSKSEVCLFHDEPIDGEFSWAEYDQEDSNLHLVNEEGGQFLLIDEIGKDMTPYLKNATQILMVLTDGENMIEGVDIPLIVREK